ncbi:MAG: AraC family transcriptional regulator [Christensenellales bacterium]
MNMIEDVVVFPFQEDNTTFCVRLMGIAYCDPKYKIYRKKTNIYCIEYVLDGVGYIVYNNRTHKVQKGDLYIVRAHTSHLYFSDKENPITKICINAYGDLIDKLLQCYDINETVFHNTDTLPIFEELFSLAKQKVDELYFQMQTALAIHRIFINIVQTRNRISPIPEHIEQLKKLIDDMINDKINLDILAQKTHISKAHLIRSFKKYYGSTPYDYILTQKIKSAKILLSTSTLSIKEISEKLCFADEHYFSTVFKQKVGVNPTTYAKSYRSKRSNLPNT